MDNYIITLHNGIDLDEGHPYFQAIGAIMFLRGTALQFSDGQVISRFFTKSLHVYKCFPHRSLIVFSVLRWLSTVDPIKYRRYPRQKCLLIQFVLLLVCVVFNLPPVIPDSTDENQSAVSVISSLRRLQRETEVSLSSAS